MTLRSAAVDRASAEDPFRPLTSEQAAMFEANPNPVLILDGQFRIRYVNPASAAYGEVDPTSLVGEHIWTRYPLLKDSIFSQAYEAVMRDGTPTRFEDRENVPQRWSAVYAYPFDGGVIAILEDVTERRRSELALQASEEALARAQSLAAIGSWSFSATDGLQLSAEAFRLLGLDPTRARVDLAAIRDRLVPEQRDQLGAALNGAAVGDDVHITVQFERFDGQDIALDVLLRVSRRINAQVMQVYGTIQDVTDRVRANEALSRSEKTLRLAQEAANIGSFDRDLRTQETTWSDQLMRILGLEPGSIDPQRIDRDPALNLVYPDDREIVREAYRRAVTTGEKQIVRNRVIRADGALRHLLGSVMLVRDDAGAPVRLVGTAIDITEQVSADEQRQRLEAQIQQAQKLESLGILAGGIAHDFNNLLVGILGNASLALLTIDGNHESHESIVEIERAAQRAAELTRQLLAYAGKGRFVVEPVDASSIVHEMSALLRTAISRTASMQLDLATGLPAIEVDTTQFRQVVMNLITNASDALADQGGLISLRTGVREVSRDFLERCVPGTNAEPGRFVFIEVTDTGVGMDPVTVSRVFDPFFSTKFTGRGLGLAATLGIVRSHRGAIRVYSEVSKGTSFCLLFPASAQPAASAPTARDSTWQGQGHVLIVDDEASVRAVTTALLTRRGFLVTTAENGAVALELFGADPTRYSLVLLDLTMPGMDGQATFRALREIRDDVRVLLMSGYNEQEVTRLFVGRGLAGFLQKPFRAEDLYAKVASTLGIVPNDVN
jgi:PAS domain S-box-containing protein